MTDTVSIQGHRGASASACYKFGRLSGAATDADSGIMAELQPQHIQDVRLAEDLLARDAAVSQPPLPEIPAWNIAMPGRLTILVADHEPQVYHLLASAFDHEFEIVEAKEGKTALAMAAARMPGLILIDGSLPGIDGYEICSNLKSRQDTRHIPIIILLTPDADVDAETRALEMGATDFILKPVNTAALMARVANQMNLRRMQDQLLQVASQRYLDDIDTEIERLAAKDRARTVEMQIKDKFLTHVSHELRAPLTAIYLLVSLMADRIAGATTPQQDEYLMRTLDNVEQMKSMVDDLLDTASIRNGKIHLSLHPVALADAVDYALDTLKKSLLKKDLKVAANASQALERAYADPARVRQILVILIENAIRYTPQEGKVTVTVSAGEDAGFLMIEVEDTGCGMAPEICAEIFERLYQADSSDQGRMGLGLGLHIAKELVKVQGGRIWVESVPDKGSIFRFTLPVFDGQPETPMLDEFEV